jgi:hypothetical protein
MCKRDQAVVCVDMCLIWAREVCLAGRFGWRLQGGCILRKLDGADVKEELARIPGAVGAMDGWWVVVV